MGGIQRHDPVGHHHRNAVKTEKERLTRAAKQVGAASGELSVLYTSAHFGHDDIIEIREIYVTLTNVADRLRELAKRTKT